MLTPFLGQAYVARSANAADNVLRNLYPEAVPEGGETAGFFNRAPGLRLLGTVGDGPIRGVWTFGGLGYVVSGDYLYKVTTAYASTLLGTVSGSGPVSMSDNGTQLFIACNPDGYIYNASTAVFAQITDADFPGAVQVDYIDGFFVFTEPDSQRVWATDLLDGTSVEPLSFASAEAMPDGLRGLIVDHRELWLFGNNSTEVWYNAGTAGFPFSRIQGAFLETGILATFSIAKLDNSIFWLGADQRGNGIIYRANGYTGQRVSTHAVEWEIQQYDDLDEAVAYTYQQDGHSFYVLTFPTAGETWVYDVATGAWHKRNAFYQGRFVQQRPICQMNFDGEIVVGDYENGKLYAYDLDVYTDAGPLQKWVRSWRALPKNENNLTRSAQHSLTLDYEAGVGLNEGQGDDPMINLRWSDDGGHTWSNHHTATMGRIGETGHRAIWRRLGMTEKLRTRVYEVSGTDPVKIALMGALINISGTSA